jgi:aspartyl/asparaginyl beta-hydroxylase (cupin superfamily)
MTNILHLLVILFFLVEESAGFVPFAPSRSQLRTALHAGFGKSASGGSSNKGKKKNKQATRFTDTLEDKTKKEGSANKPFVKSEQDDLIASLAQKASSTCIGQAVASAPVPPEGHDPFWELMPSLLSSRFPNVPDNQFERVAGMVRHALDPDLPLEDSIINDPYRPHDEIHAYMPGLGPTEPFLDPAELQLCTLLTDNYDTIRKEYETLLQDKEDRFQSVTSMNYKSGWKTMILFYNGHRIPDFPYHLCPTTTKILETVPLAGRIAGFNRQKPSTGIPLHSDGNNMWLTCQMGVEVPEGEKAWIRVGSETKHWQQGECLLYDTTYEHETMNEHETTERVVLHVDFFNTLKMTPIEIEVMQYIYSLREQFMKAEGVAKVGKHIL